MEATWRPLRRARWWPTPACCAIKWRRQLHYHQPWRDLPGRVGVAFIMATAVVGPARVVGASPSWEGPPSSAVRGGHLGTLARSCGLLVYCSSTVHVLAGVGGPRRVHLRARWGGGRQGGGWLGALFLSKAGDYSWPRSVHVLPCFRVPYLLVIRRFVWKLEIWAPRAHEIACAITMRPRR